MTLAFVELLKLHSHSDRIVNIYVKENSEVFVFLGYAYVINLKEVNIQTYTDSTFLPRRSTIVMKEIPGALLSVKTRINIIRNVELNLGSYTQNSNLTQKERSEILSNVRAFTINRCDFTISNFIIKSDSSSSTRSHSIFRAIYQQSKQVKILNVDIVSVGVIFRATDPLNLHVENVYIDYSILSRGFYMLCAWNYSEAALGTEVVFRNITVKDSDLRSVPISNSLISYAGPGNFTLLNSEIHQYGSALYPYSPIQYNTMSSCFPSDSRVQKVTIENNTFSFPQNEDNSRFFQIYMSISDAYSRKVEISLNNNLFVDFKRNARPLIEIYGNGLTYVFSRGLGLVNSSFQSSAIYFSKPRLVSLAGYTFSNITLFKRALLQLVSVPEFVVNGMTVQADLAQTGTVPVSDDNVDYQYFIEHSSVAGYTNFTGLKFKNLNTYRSYPLFLSGVSSFKLSNSSFENMVIHPDRALIKTSSLAELEIKNVNFTKIRSYTLGDKTNIILDINDLDIGKSTDHLISKIVVAESELAFLRINKLTNPTSIGKTIRIDDFEYRDSFFADTNDLLSFFKMELDITSSIALSNIRFKNVEFKIKGNLLHFEQQLRNPLTVSNLQIESTKNSYIYLEASNPQNTVLRSRVSMTNVTTKNVFAGFSSLISALEGVVLEIRNSTLSNVYSFGEGAVLYAGYQEAIVSIYDSTIQFNSALQGGAFKVESNSIIKLYNWLVTNNFALLSGVLMSSNNGLFEFYNTNFTFNSAQAVLISQLYDNPIDSVLSNCLLSSNEQYTKSSILSFINNPLKCGLICFLPEKFKQYLRDNNEKMDQVNSRYLFQLISSSIRIGGNTIIVNQPAVVDAFVAIVTINSTTYRDSRVSGNAFQITNSRLIFEGVTLRNLTSSSSSQAISYASLESNVYVNNLVYQDSSAQLFTSQSSSWVVNNLTAVNLNPRRSLMRIEQGINATLTNWSLDDVSVSGYAIQMIDSYIHQFENVTMRKFSGSNMSFIR